MVVHASGIPVKGPIFPEFEIDSEKVIVPVIDCESVKHSGLRLSRTDNLGKFFDVAGHHSLLMGREGGDFEAWFYPFKAFDNCEIGFLVDHSIVWADTIRKTYNVTPEASIVTYEMPGLRISQTIFAPVNEPGLIMLFKVASKKPVTLIAKLKPTLKLMWPANEDDLNQEIGIDKGTNAWVLRSKDQRVVAMAGWACGGSSTRVPADERFDDAIVLTKEVVPDHLCSLVLAGSIENFEETRRIWVKLAKNPHELLQAASSYYHNLDAESLSVSTPDKALNEAFRWAKIGLDKCYKSVPGLGAGFVAGFDRSNDGARPGFGWFFGRDSSWTQFSFNAMGEFTKSRENLDLLAKYQIKDGDNKGKIYHEISAAHEFFPEGGRLGYAYFAGDATPFYVVDMADYLRWTGDLDYIRENWQHVLDALDWCRRMDVDGDHLIDNPPAGHQWYDYGEKNMVDLVAIWCKALESAAEMGRLLGDDKASDWQAEAEIVRQILNTDFWDESRGYLYDRKLPDGTMNTLTTANPTIPLLWNQIEPDKANEAVDRMVQPDLAVAWGLRTNSSKDPIYRPSGYHEGTVWPLVTGWGSLACFNNHRAAEGLMFLKANADLYKELCLGYITEVVDGGEKVPIGCPHQAWSEAMVVQPMVDGLLGIRVDAMQKKIIFSPHVPEDWTSVKIRNLKVSGNCYDISYEHKDGKVRVAVKQLSGPDEYTAVISPAFKPSVADVKAWVNGESAKCASQKTPVDIHFTVTAAICQKLVVEYSTD